MTSSDTCVVRVASLVTGPPLDSCVLSKMNPLLLAWGMSVCPRERGTAYLSKYPWNQLG